MSKAWAIFLIVLSGFVGCLAGVKIKSEATPQYTNELIPVKILSVHNYPDEKKGRWYLLQTDDQQRCYIEHYRGEVGTRFNIHPSDLNGYHAPKLLTVEDDLDKLTIVPKVNKTH